MFTLSRENAAFLKLEETPLPILNHIKDEFSFFIPQYRFTRAWKQGKQWNGKIILLKKNKFLYSGLLETLKDFLTQNKYPFKDTTGPRQVHTFFKSDFIDFIANIPLKIPPRDYQLNSVLELLDRQKTILISPTASGKSYILFLALLFILKQRWAKKILIVVPTVSLVLQMYKDFISYCYNDKTEKYFTDKIHLIFQGKERHNNSPITISTYQSLLACEPEFFTSFDAVVADEVHLMSKTSGQQILEYSTNAELRWGMTGTLQESQLDLLVLTGLFGKAVQLVRTSELMDKGFVANLKINNIILKYSPPLAKLIKSMNFQDEYEYIISLKERQDIINSFVTQLTGNTLVLFTRIELQGEKLFSDLQTLNPNKQVFFLSGKNTAEEREEARNITEKSNNVILVCSYGIFSTGVSINNLHNVVFASPYKSKIKILQSIGRGLRLHESKDFCYLYDFVDDARFNNDPNYFFSHFIDRYLLYCNEGFECRNINYQKQIDLH